MSSSASGAAGLQAKSTWTLSMASPSALPGTARRATARPRPTIWARAGRGVQGYRSADAFAPLTAGAWLSSAALSSRVSLILGGVPVTIPFATSNSCTGAGRSFFE